MRSSNRRILRFGLGAVMMSTAACSAIAGLDGEFELDDAGSVSNLPDSNTGVDGNPSTTDGGNKDTGTTTDGQPPTDTGVDAPADAPVDAPVDAPKDTGIDSGPTIDVDPTPPPTITPKTGSGGFCPPIASFPSGWIFCWDFGGNDTAANNFGWSFVETDQGTVALDGAVNTYDRMLLTNVTTPGPTLNGGAGLWININAHPSFYSVGHTVTYTFSFRVIAGATASASLGLLESRGDRYGLTFHPASSCINTAKPCLTDNTAKPLKQTAFDFDAWYTAKISVTRRAVATSDTWDGKIVVGGATTKTISTVSDIFKPGHPDPIRLGTGELDPQAPAGSAIARIDDVIFEDQP